MLPHGGDVTLLVGAVLVGLASLGWTSAKGLRSKGGAVISVDQSASPAAPSRMRGGDPAAPLAVGAVGWRLARHTEA